jgi:iron complex transport system ATP-binding protein
MIAVRSYIKPISIISSLMTEMGFSVIMPPMNGIGDGAQKAGMGGVSGAEETTLPRIQADGITAGYGAQPVLKNVSLTLMPGEMVGLIGPNGAGKSTLLRVLSRTLPPQQGQVRLDGEPVRKIKSREIARRIAFVPQTEPTLFDFTVRDVVLMGRHAHLNGLSGETERDFAAATQAMALTDTLPLADRLITELSGGEHRRVLIARALAQEAPTLLLDEPTAHLDITHQADVLAIIRRLADREGTAVLVALHDLNLAAEFCDRLILLAKGAILADGPPDVVMTSQNLELAYGASVSISRNPVSGKPFILSTFPSADLVEGAPLSVHVVCGGGTGISVLWALRRRGWLVTVGVLNSLDSDEEAAHALFLATVSEAPFSPVSPQARKQCAALMAAADVIIVSEVPIGKGNLANLELVSEAQGKGKVIYLLGEGNIEDRDYTDGEATALWEKILQNGGTPVSNQIELDRHLAVLSHQS